MRVAPGPESAPSFPDGSATVTRYLAERTPAIATGEPVGPGDPVGAPVAAKAANTDETLAYSLEGSDAKYFNIDQMGQITVGGDAGNSEAGTDPKIDYDDPEKQQTFRVTVKVEVVNGDANQVAQVNVDIIVTDINEPPTVVDEEGGAAKTAVDDYPEIDEGAPNTKPVATYVGTDPEGARIIWDVRGADAALFTIDGGVLKFRSAPDFENP